MLQPVIFRNVQTSILFCLCKIQGNANLRPGTFCTDASALSIHRFFVVYLYLLQSRALRYSQNYKERILKILQLQLRCAFPLLPLVYNKFHTIRTYIVAYF
jgi:hypothetical protein